MRTCDFSLFWSHHLFDINSAFQVFVCDPLWVNPWAQPPSTGIMGWGLPPWVVTHLLVGEFKQKLGVTWQRGSGEM